MPSVPAIAGSKSLQVVSVRKEMGMPIEHGTVTHFNRGRGFGFIEPDTGGKNIYFSFNAQGLIHEDIVTPGILSISSLPKGSRTLSVKVGDRLVYHPANNPRGPVGNPWTTEKQFSIAQEVISRRGIDQEPHYQVREKAAGTQERKLIWQGRRLPDTLLEEAKKVVAIGLTATLWPTNREVYVETAHGWQFFATGLELRENKKLLADLAAAPKRLSHLHRDLNVVSILNRAYDGYEYRPMTIDDIKPGALLQRIEILNTDTPEHLRNMGFSLRSVDIRLDPQPIKKQALMYHQVGHPDFQCFTQLEYALTQIRPPDLCGPTLTTIFAVKKKK